jgi:broad specificity phosphatase PhoE
MHASASLGKDKMRLLFIRHADPDYANDTITEVGHEQARRLTDTLVGEKIDEILSSSYGRAMNTASYAAKRFGLEISSQDWLREVNGNYNPGHPGTLGYHGADLFADGQPVNTENWTERAPYGGHTLEHSRNILEGFAAFMAARGYSPENLRYRVTKDAEQRTAAIFCHAGSILTLLAEILHIPVPTVYAQFFVDPASVTAVHMETKAGYGIFRLEYMNSTAHLGDRKTEVQQKEWDK